MPDIGCIIVTAKNVGHKLLNRLHCHLQASIIFCEQDDWRILTSKDISLFEGFSKGNDGEPDIFPLTEFSNNEWAGASIAEVERFAHNDGTWDLPGFLILDDRGVQEETIVLADNWLDQVDWNSPNQPEYYRDPDSGDLKKWAPAPPGFTEYADVSKRYKDLFCKVRLPWIQALDAYQPVVQLNKGLTSWAIEYPCDDCWRELCREEGEGDRWYLNKNIDDPMILEKFEKERPGVEREIEKFRTEGLA